MSKLKYISSIALIGVLYTSNTSAQTSTASPYSMFGLGEFVEGSTGMFAITGASNVSLRDKGSLNVSNPAAMTALIDNSFLMEIGAYADYRHYNSGGTTNNATFGNIRNFSMGCKLFKNAYAGAGIVPLTSVGYSMQTTEQVEGSTSTINTSYKGEGGLTKAYASFAYQLNSKLSLGATLGYIYGSIDQTESQDASSITIASYGRVFYPDFGAQYTSKLNDNYNISLGLTYGYEQKIVMNNDKTTAVSSSVTENLKSTTQYLPQHINFGASVTNKKYILTAEYQYKDFSKLESSNSKIEFIPQHKVSLNADMLSAAKMGQRFHYIAGTSLSNSYIKVSGDMGYVWGASVGAVIPTNSLGSVSLGLKYENQFYPNGKGINMQSIMFNLQLTIGEFSFIKKL